MFLNPGVPLNSIVVGVETIVGSKIIDPPPDDSIRQAPRADSRSIVIRSNGCGLDARTRYVLLPPLPEKKRDPAPANGGLLGGGGPMFSKVKPSSVYGRGSKLVESNVTVVAAEPIAASISTIKQATSRRCMDRMRRVRSVSFQIESSSELANLPSTPSLLLHLW